MNVDRRLLERIRARGEEVLTQLSAELASNPGLAKVVEGAVRGREKLEEVAARAMARLPLQRELRRANARIAALEREVSELRRAARRTGARPAAGSRGGSRVAGAGRGSARAAAGRPKAKR